MHDKREILPQAQVKRKRKNRTIEYRSHHLNGEPSGSPFFISHHRFVLIPRRNFHARNRNSKPNRISRSSETAAARCLKSYFRGGHPDQSKNNPAQKPITP
jgi:hypothetical protein